MKGETCLSAEAIADLIRGASTDEQDRHVQACPACARRLGLLRRVVSAGVVQVAQTIAEVDELIRRLVDAPHNSWWKVVLEPDYKRPDLVRRLLSLVLDARLRDPRTALAFANAATSIVDRLEPITEVGELRFDAWLYTASLLREAGRYTETDHALAKAEDAAQEARDPELALASVFLSRALLNAEPDVWRPADAAALLDRAERVYSTRDSPRMLGVVTARAQLLFRAGDSSSARDRFAELLDITSTTDREAYLNAMSNLMWVRVERHETDPDIEQAVRLLVDENLALGRTEVVARARWMMGRICALRGDYDTAVTWLRTAMEEITGRDTWIRIGMDAVEALLLGNRHFEALQLARELATAAVALDQREPSRRRALTAQVLAYLREAAQREVWTADLVADLSRYVDRITRQRPVDFVPPMPLTGM